MNLAIRGIEANLGPENADTFTRDLHPDLKADFILANPPFNMSDWGRRERRRDRQEALSASPGNPSPLAFAGGAATDSAKPVTTATVRSLRMPPPGLSLVASGS